MDWAIASILPSSGARRRSVAAMALAGVAATFAYWSYTELGSQWAELSTPRGSLRVLVVNDSAVRSQGLPDRDDLPGDGMLLQWNARGRHPIWMADMRFPLDLVWLEHDGLVAGVLTNVPVCSSQPCPLYEPQGTHQSVAVLELAAGAVKDHGIEPGSVIRASTSHRTRDELVARSASMRREGTR